jgi:hypothetical protein
MLGRHQRIKTRKAAHARRLKALPAVPVTFASLFLAIDLSHEPVVAAASINLN